MSPAGKQNDRDGDSSVDARGAVGLQVGEHNTQIIYSYNRLTWTDGVAPPPLVSFSGHVESPYRGLGAYEEQDAAFFFGRETAVDQLLERIARTLNGTGLLIVSGVSGAGKSSLLRAGVLPQIRGTGLRSSPGSASWPCLLFTPTHAPLDELAIRVASLAGVDAAGVQRGLNSDPQTFGLTARQAALVAQRTSTVDPVDSTEHARTTPPNRLLLVIDQFEQLFTLCPSEDERRAFIKALHAAASVRSGPDDRPAALVVLGVRADFEARCASYPELTDAVQNRFLVTAMTEQQLRLAIVEPAKKVGSSVDEDLVRVLLAQAGTGQPGPLGAGVLPLLSHALDQAWRHRSGKTLTLTDYERTGGIEGAVADSAQRAYDSCTPSQQATARQVFTQLTAVSGDGVDTAARVARTDLAEGKTPAEQQDVAAVLDAFGSERLLTFSADSVQISHEVLLTAWPLLRDVWLAESHADRIVRTRVGNAAAEWDGHSRDRSYLYRGSLLQAASETAERIAADPARYPALTGTERAFLQASERARRGSVRRLRSLLAFLVALVAGLAATTVLAYRDSQQAAGQRDLAVSALLATDSEQVGDGNPVVARLLSVAAWRLSPSQQARDAMLSTAALPGIRLLSGPTGPVRSVAYAPDGKIVASAGQDGMIRLWNAANGRQIRAVSGRAVGILSVAFSPDGRTLASGATDGSVRLWDVATGRQVGPTMTAREGAVLSLAFSPDGRTLATAQGASVTLWDVATGRLIGPPMAAGTVSSVAFSPDGRTLATGGTDFSARLWNAATGREIGRPLAEGNTVMSVAFSRDGQFLVLGAGDGSVTVWRVANGVETGAVWTGINNGVPSLAFSPDGRLLASGGGDGAIRLFDLTTGHDLGTALTGHTGPVWSVAFSPDSKTLISGGQDGTVRLWDIAPYRQITGPVTTNTADIATPVAFSPDGKTVAISPAGGAVQLWDAATGRKTGQPLDPHAYSVNTVKFSPDGRTLAISANNNAGTVVQLWDVASGRMSRTLPPRDVYSLAFSPDGTALTIAEYGGTVRAWDVRTGQPRGRPLVLQDALVSGVLEGLSQEGNLLAATSTTDNRLRLWDVATAKEIGGPLTPRDDQLESLAFSPNGNILAVADASGTIGLWDTASGRKIGSDLPTAGGPVWALAFSPDGHSLASGSLDGTIRLWDVDTRLPIGDARAANAMPVESLAFSPDGRTLATSSSDGSVRLWETPYLGSDLADYLCAVAGRTLTTTEWRQYASQGPGYRSVCP